MRIHNPGGRGKSLYTRGRKEEVTPSPRDYRRTVKRGLGEAVLLLEILVLLDESVHAVDHALHQLHLNINSHIKD
jgi:hypothetical protein